MIDIKRPMLLCRFLMLDTAFAGLMTSLGLVACETLIFLLRDHSPDELFTSRIEESGFGIVYTAALIIAMALLAASIAGRWFGSKSEVSLHMLPVNRAWMFIGWTAGGVIMLLMLTAAQHIAVRLAYLIYSAAVDRFIELGYPVYIEPDAVWYAFRRVGALSWVLPQSRAEWARYLMLTLGAPIVVTRSALGVLAGDLLLPALSAAGFIASVVLSCGDVPMSGILLSVLVTVWSAVDALELLRDGDAV